MQHEAELHFFQKLLEQFHLNFRILCDSHGTIPDPDLGLRRLLNPDTDYLLEFQRLCSHCKPQRVYKIQDEFSVTISFSGFLKARKLPMLFSVLTV